MNDKKNLEWFIGQKNVFAWEMTIDDFLFYKNKIGIVSTGAMGNYIAGIPIRIKESGDITVIRHICCKHCGQKIKG